MPEFHSVCTRTRLVQHHSARVFGKATMKLDHPPLADLLQRAYSAEMAAAFAYVGHASSLKDPASKIAENQIEVDEWNHRKHVLALMQKYEVPVSRYYEGRFYLIGK